MATGFPTRSRSTKDLERDDASRSKARAVLYTPRLLRLNGNSSKCNQSHYLKETMRRMLMRCGAVFLGLVLAAGAASAEDKTFELKLSHWVPPTHPLQKAIEEWGADVEKASGGTIKYKIFPSQQLGKAFDHYDMARDGIADLVYVNPGYQPGRFPIIAAGELPFLIGDVQGGIRADRQLVSQIRSHRDEGREILLLVHSRPADLALEATKRSWCRPTSRA